jgi:hypothetical protein
MEITDHHRLLDGFVDRIPSDAAVTATASVHPHVSHRLYVYQFPLGLDGPDRATWALIDVTTDTDMAPGDVKSAVDAMLAADWSVVDAANGYLLLRRSAGNKEIPERFGTFFKPEKDDLQEPKVRALDWPRWRLTQIEATWPEWDPTLGVPRVEVVTPGGETIYTLATSAPPALVWNPADEWRAGDGHRITTLGLALPRSVAVATGALLPELVLRRTRDDQLLEQPFAALLEPGFSEAIEGLTAWPLAMTETEFETAGDPLALSTWIEERPLWPGDTLDLWLQWRGDDWPEAYVPFVHLRQDGVNVSQQDGLPRLFVAQDAQSALTTEGFVNDWRTLSVPATLEAGDRLSVVVGLYDPSSGKRLRLSDGSAEMTVAEYRLSAAVPDQACALNESSCASQPEIYP